jgi:hypothetical protein
MKSWRMVFESCRPALNKDCVQKGPFFYFTTSAPHHSNRLLNHVHDRIRPERSFVTGQVTEEILSGVVLF